jgi:hypothetical protein
MRQGRPEGSEVAWRRPRRAAWPAQRSPEASDVRLLERSEGETDGAARGTAMSRCSAEGHLPGRTAAPCWRCRHTVGVLRSGAVGLTIAAEGAFVVE